MLVNLLGEYGNCEEWNRNEWLKELKSLKRVKSTQKGSKVGNILRDLHRVYRVIKLLIRSFIYFFTHWCSTPPLLIVGCVEGLQGATWRRRTARWGGGQQTGFDLHPTKNNDYKSPKKDAPPLGKELLVIRNADKSPTAVHMLHVTQNVHHMELCGSRVTFCGRSSGPATLESTVNFQHRDIICVDNWRHHGGISVTRRTVLPKLLLGKTQDHGD